MPDPDALLIRSIAPGDTLPLIDLVRRCYGESYPNEMMYKPEAIEEAIATELMYSIVCLDSSGNLIGHCALTFNNSDAPVPEAGKMIVDPAYRGHHLANLLSERRKEVAQEKSMVGYWSECVTNHPYSQDEIIKSGGHETGLFLSKDSSTFQMVGVNNVTDVRLSLLTFYIPLKDQSNQKIYLPRRHVLFASQMAASIGLDRQILSEADSVASESKLVFTTHESDQFAQIEVVSIGSDLLLHVTKLVEQLEHLGIAVIHIDLPIGHPNAIHAIDELEQIGFFWAAWMPEFSVAGDILRLQKTESAINTEEIVCARERGEDIKLHVIKERNRVLGIQSLTIGSLCEH